MTDTGSPGAGAASSAPAWRPLTPGQRRVLGVLIEKAKTTPAAYPLTLNAVVTGCNQKNNREQVMNLAPSDVEQILDELRALGAVNEVYESGRVPKYRHQGYHWLGVDKPEIAVMTELLLRGEQSLGDLRARAARMEPIADLAALRPIVEALIARGLMVALTAPGRGQIVSHHLYPERELAGLRTRFAGFVPAADDEPRAGEPRAFAAAMPSPGRTDAAPAANAADVEALAAQVTELRAEVARLREEIRDLEARLTSALG